MWDCVQGRGECCLEGLFLVAGPMNLYALLAYQEANRMGEYVFDTGGTNGIRFLSKGKELDKQID